MMIKKNANKSELECYYCGKIGHTLWNCKNCANDMLKGKIKESMSITTHEYSLNFDDEFNEAFESLKLF